MKYCIFHEGREYRTAQYRKLKDVCKCAGSYRGEDSLVRLYCFSPKECLKDKTAAKCKS